MSEHPAQLDDDELLKLCSLSRVKRSGPGGQRRNKVETGVVLTHKPTGIRAEASDSRSASQNQTTALRRLREQLAIEIRKVDSEATLEEFSPSRQLAERCQNGKIVIRASHPDVPALQGELLDLLTLANGDFRNAAEVIEVSTSQLRKFLQSNSEVQKIVDKIRTDNDLPRLKH